MMIRKPEILFFADYPNWAFHHIYRSISLRLHKKFKFDIYFSSLSKSKKFKKKLLKKYDFIWITSPGDKKYLQLNHIPNKIIKEVASWRWQNRYKTTEEFCKFELEDADIVVTPSLALYLHLSNHIKNVSYVPNGVESWFFKCKKRKSKPINELIYGWVGNSTDNEKNFDIIQNLQNEGLNIRIAQNMNLFELRKFYSGIDVLLITSKRESQPLTLLESIAAGCYVIATNVGIVSEILEKSTLGCINDDWSKESVIKICKTINVRLEDKIDVLRKNDWSIIVNHIFILFQKPKFELLSTFNRRYIESKIVLSENSLLFKFRFILKVFWDLIVYGKRFN